MLSNQAKHTVDVSSAKELKETLEAAETVGLEFREARVHGKWDYHEDVAINSHAGCEIANIGRKWITLRVDGELIEGMPITSRMDAIDDGTLELLFD